ncbi:MAG: site-specific integrase [Desulfovibrio sp.]|nr:site-specific integrase [Desulfovibrio sp.]
MAIRYRKNRKAPWQVYWNNPFTGKRESVSFDTEAEAKKEESLVKHRLKFDRDSFKKEETEEEDTAELTVEQVYMLYLKAKNFDKYCLSCHIGKLRWLLNEIGDTPVSQLNLKILKKLIEKMLVRTDIKPVTVRGHCAVLKTVLRWGAAQELYPPIPFPALPNASYEQFIPPTQEELAKMLEVSEPHIQRVIVLGSQFGMRIGPCELFQLTWNDVDLRQGILRVHGSKKNKNAQWREVPIRSSLKALFEQWQQEDLEKGVQYLISHNGKPVGTIKTAWRNTLRRAGITRRIRPYDLRHTFATEAIAAGADIGTVARLLGHSSPTMILQHYQFVMDKQKRAVVEALPEFKYVPKNMCPKKEAPTTEP